MLERYTDQLMFETRDAADFLLLPELEDRNSWEAVAPQEKARLLRRAEEYLRQDAVPQLTASAYMAYRRKGDLSGYPEAYRRRRDMLRVLTLAVCLNPGSDYDRLLTDVIFAICEETSWVLPANNPAALGEDPDLLPEPGLPLVDYAAAETAGDLCLCIQLIGRHLDGISPQLCRRMAAECEARVIGPMAEYRDLEWMCGPHGETARCLAGCMAAFLTLTEDSRRRWLCLRKVWLLLDRILTTEFGADGSVPGGLSVAAWQQAVAPVMDCLMMVYSASQGRVDARREQAIQLMCHYPVLCHVGEGWFVNLGEQSMCPVLDAEAMLRIGEDAGDEALCDLAVCMHQWGRSAQAGERTLWHEGRALFDRPRLSEETPRPPFRREGYLPDAQLMTARMAEDDTKGLAIAMHGGDNGAVDGHADVGDILLFSDGRAVLADGAAYSGSQWHSLPTVGGVDQALGSGFGARDVVCELKEEYALMGMDLAAAYPRQAGIYSWQRTFVLSREEGGAQLVEAFDLDGFRLVEFHFMLGVEPRLGENYAQIGPVRMRWEGRLLPTVNEVEALPGTPEGKLWRLSLLTPAPVDGGEFAFQFSELRSFG